MPDKCVTHSYTAAELAVLLKKQAADRIVKPHAHAAIHHWDTWESAVEGTLEWKAAEFLMRQVGPLVPDSGSVGPWKECVYKHPDAPRGGQWKKVGDGEGTPDAEYIKRHHLGHPVTFWTMYEGEFYEYTVTLPQLPPPATSGGNK